MIARTVSQNGFNSSCFFRTWLEPGTKHEIPLFSNEDGYFFIRRNGHTIILNNSDMDKIKNRKLDSHKSENLPTSHLNKSDMDKIKIVKLDSDKSEDTIPLNVSNFEKPLNLNNFDNLKVV